MIASLPMNDREIAELENIFERHVDEMIKKRFGPEPTPEQLGWLAQELEENADSYGADPVRYLRADVAWGRAFETAERVGEASLKERLAAAYAFDTPVAREAREQRGQQLEEVPVINSREALREIDFDAALESLGIERDDGFGYEL